jgi:hypothetical protein
MRFAFLSDGKLFVKNSGVAPREIESTFAAERAAREQERVDRHAWKGAGRDPQDTYNAQTVWGRQAGGRGSGDDSAPVFRHLAAGASPDELLYVLEMSASSGLFRHKLSTGEEHRVFHRRDFFCAGLACDRATGDIVFSAADRSGLANLEKLGPDRASDRALTDGEARDTEPSHVPGAAPGTLVFQSAGAGRDGEGRLLAFGPSAILRLTPGAADLETLVELDTHDHLAPRVAPDGSLYFIRRHYQDFARPGLVAQLKNFVLMPYHLGAALFGFLDAFSRIFGRAPLRPAGGPETRRPPERRWVSLHGTSLDLAHALKRHERGDDSASLVPASWQLIRLAPDGREEIVANRVACHALAPDGALFYSNGFTVWRRAPDTCATEVVHRGKIIQALAAL